MMAGLPLYTQLNILSLLGDCSQLLPKLPLLDLLSQYVFGCTHSEVAPAASTKLDVNSAALVAALCCDLYRRATFSQQQLERVNGIAAAANSVLDKVAICAPAAAEANASRQHSLLYCTADGITHRRQLLGSKQQLAQSGADGPDNVTGAQATLNKADSSTASKRPRAQELGQHEESESVELTDAKRRRISVEIDADEFEPLVLPVPPELPAFANAAAAATTATTATDKDQNTAAEQSLEASISAVDAVATTAGSATVATSSAASSSAVDTALPAAAQLLPESLTEGLAAARAALTAAAKAPGSSREVNAAAAAVASLLLAAATVALPGCSSAVELVCTALHTTTAAASTAASSKSSALEIADDVLVAICSKVVSPSLSLRSCKDVVQGLLLPRARALTAPASRVLVTGITSVAKQRPEAVVDGLLLPLLCTDSSSSSSSNSSDIAVGSAHCELCLRLLRQVLPKHLLQGILVALCTQSSSSSNSSDSCNSEATSVCEWTDFTVPVVTALLNMQLQLSDEAVSAVAGRIEAASELPALQSSLKFGTLVHVLLTKYSAQAAAHCAVLQTANARLTTFMAKSCSTALEKLRAVK
jgi:Fanconi Anaemia group E protein FANCE